MEHLKKYVLVYTLVPFMILFISASYFRFVIQHDYIVAYEATCDPSTESCFIGCEDETCSSTYTYKLMEKYAATLYGTCGQDITDCAFAHTCISTETQCRVTYCDPTTEQTECSESNQPPSEVMPDN
jgi:hypothetical protein